MKQLLVILSIFLFPAISALSIQLPWLTEKQQSGSFTQEKHIKALSRPFITKGHYSFTPEHGLSWHTVSPVKNQLLINKQGISEVQRDGSIKAITSDSSVSQLLLPIFSANSDLLEKQFSLSETAKGLSLKPLNVKIQSIIQLIDLTVQQQKLQQIELHEVNGNRTVITLSPATLTEN